MLAFDSKALNGAFDVALDSNHSNIFVAVKIFTWKFHDGIGIICSTIKPLD